MSNFFIEARGFKELEEEVSKIAESEQIKVNKDILKTCAKRTQERAKELAPRSAEHSKSGVKHKGKARLTPPTSLGDGIPISSITGQDKSNMSIRVGWKNLNQSDYVYARWVEYGSSKMKPRPFLENALHETEGEFINIATEKYNTLVGRLNDV